MALIEAILAAYKARAGDMAEAISLEMGAPDQPGQDRAGRLRPRPPDVRRPRRSGNSGSRSRSATASVVHEPIGVVAMITPWNWPLNQIVSKVAPALAAGCTMVLKPSEEAPGCAMIFAEVLAAAGVPAGVFNLVNGDGPGVGTALAATRASTW